MQIIAMAYRHQVVGCFQLGAALHHPAQLVVLTGLHFYNGVLAGLQPDDAILRRRGDDHGVQMLQGLRIGQRLRWHGPVGIGCSHGFLLHMYIGMRTLIRTPMYAGNGQ